MMARIWDSMRPTEEAYLAGNETRENPHEQTNDELRGSLQII